MDIQTQTDSGLVFRMMVVEGTIRDSTVVVVLGRSHMYTYVHVYMWAIYIREQGRDGAHAYLQPANLPKDTPIYHVIFPLNFPQLKKGFPSNSLDISN